MYFPEKERISIAKEEKSVAVPSNLNEVIILWKKGEITAKVAKKKLRMTPATFYRKRKIRKLF